MKIAILTSGGDAPGMNAVVINLIKNLFLSMHEVVLVKNGYTGLITNSFLKINKFDINEDYLTLSGSFIHSSRSKEFIINHELAINNLINNQIDCLIVIGGNGSYKGAKLIANYIPTIFIPATIDNDVKFTQYSVGFSSACQEIVHQCTKIKSTFKTHQNIVFVEVMGRYSNDLLITASKALLPALTISNDKKLNKLEIANRIDEYYKQYNYALILVIEHLYTSKDIDEISQFLGNQFNCDVRYNVLGYCQRGADVNYYDLVIANEFARQAVNLIDNEKFNHAVFLNNNKVITKSYELITEE